jgi:uncharacterized protein YciI
MGFKKKNKEELMYYILLYEIVDDYVKKRAPFREEHLRLADAAARKGQLLLGGAFNNPVDGAALVFKADERSIVEEFVKNDPYVKNGLITKWKVRDWTVVVGSAMCEG